MKSQACPAMLSGSGIEKLLAQFMGPCICTRRRSAAGGVTQRRGDCSGLATTQLFHVCMHTGFCWAGVETSQHASEREPHPMKLHKYLQS